MNTDSTTNDKRKLKKQIILNMYGRYFKMNNKPRVTVYSNSHSRYRHN